MNWKLGAKQIHDTIANLKLNGSDYQIGFDTDKDGDFWSRNTSNGWSKVAQQYFLRSDDVKEYHDNEFGTTTFGQGDTRGSLSSGSTFITIGDEDGLFGVTKSEFISRSFFTTNGGLGTNDATRFLEVNAESGSESISFHTDNGASESFDMVLDGDGIYVDDIVSERFVSLTTRGMFLRKDESVGFEATDDSLTSKSILRASTQPDKSDPLNYITVGNEGDGGSIGFYSNLEEAQELVTAGVSIITAKGNATLEGTLNIPFGTDLRMIGIGGADIGGGAPGFVSPMLTDDLTLRWGEPSNFTDDPGSLYIDVIMCNSGNLYIDSRIGQTNFGGNSHNTVVIDSIMGGSGVFVDGTNGFPSPSVNTYLFSHIKGAILVNIHNPDELPYDGLQVWAEDNDLVLDNSGGSESITISYLRWKTARDVTKLDATPDHIDFIPPATVLAYLEGRLQYDATRTTLKLDNDKEGFPLEIGRTVSAPMKADEEITKGQPLYVSSQSPGWLHVSVASNMRYNQNWVVGIAGNSGIIGDTIEFAQNGGVRGIDTSNLATQVPLYLGDGEIVDVRPKFPYADAIFIGANVFSHATEGVIGLAVGVDPYDVFFDGCVVEKHDENILVVGTDVVMDVSSEDITRNFVFQLESMEYELDTTTSTGINGAARLTLTSPALATDDPISQLVYVDLTGSVPTLKTTTGRPALPFAPIAKCKVHHHSIVSQIGAWTHRRIVSAKAHDGSGAIAHLIERFGIMAPEYESGIGLTATLDQGQSPDRITLDTQEGEVFQTHIHTWEPRNSFSDGIFVGNRPLNTNGGPKTYDLLTNIADLCGYTSSDTSRDTNSRGHITVIGQINKDTSEHRLIANPPTTLYAGNDTQAYKDYNGYAIRSVPQDEKIVSFLVAEIQYDISNTETVTFINPNGGTTTDGQYILNLLGTALNTAGGGAGAGIAFIPNLTQVVTEGANAGGVTITNAGTGVDDTDLATVGQSVQKSGDTMAGALNILDSTQNFVSSTTNQFESGRVRYLESPTDALLQGMYTHYDGDANVFHIGRHPTPDAIIANDINALSIDRQTGDVDVNGLAFSQSTAAEIQADTTLKALVNLETLNERPFTLAVGDTLTITSSTTTVADNYKDIITANGNGVEYIFRVLPLSAGTRTPIGATSSVPIVAVDLLANGWTYTNNDTETSQITIKGIGDSKFSKIQWTIT
jgi:hypothetical protein